MRDGHTVAVSAMRDMPKMELVRNMLGRELAAFEALARDAGPDDTRPVRLELKNAGSGLRVREVDLSIRRGEISGLAGLLGSGRTETARIIFGVDKLERGSLAFDGRDVAIQSRPPLSLMVSASFRRIARLTASSRT